MADGRVHIVGAGLAGLAAAVRLDAASTDVVLHEATDHAGGRCRSYFDAALGMTIDNGNHLLLSGNRETLAYLESIGAQGSLMGLKEAAFDFADLADGARWRLRLNDGRLPWWIFSAARRVPGSRPIDYLAALRLLRVAEDARIGDVLDRASPLYARLWRPILLAALNTEPEKASAALAAAVMRETLLAGGRACRPLVAAGGLSGALIDPALARLRRAGRDVRFGRRLRAIELGPERALALDFGGERLALGPEDRVILAVPPWVATSLLPGLAAPREFRAIVNAHYRAEPPAGLPRILAVVNGQVEWLFAFEGRLSVTISGADRLMDADREVLARELWVEVAKLTGLPEVLPAWQVVKEKRATFAATPEQERLRPGARSRWRNLLLAGDWTATGLPATIEGAIRSGFRAADLARESRL
jgi:squalene-associated FAD-dependent desaturase